MATSNKVLKFQKRSLDFTLIQDLGAQADPDLEIKVDAFGNLIVNDHTTVSEMRCTEILPSQPRHEYRWRHFDKAILGATVLIPILTLSLLGAQVCAADPVDDTPAAAATSRADSPASSHSASAEPIGVGFQAGQYNGLNVEYWLTERRTLNATVAGEQGNSALSVDHRWMFRDAFTDRRQGRTVRSLVPYAGLGAVVLIGSQSDVLDRNNEEFAWAVQVPLGIEFLPAQERFSVFAQIIPSLEMVPISVPFLTGDIGARFYF